MSGWETNNTMPDAWAISTTPDTGLGAVTSSSGEEVDLYRGEDLSLASRVCLFSLYVLSTLVGLFGSGLVIFTLIADDVFLHAPGTYTSYLTNLVATDLFFQLYYFPLLAVGLLQGRYPVLGRGHCVFNGFSLFATSIVFMFTLAAISCDRYLFVCHHSKYKAVASRRVSVLVCAAMWVLSCLVCVPFVLDGTIGFDSKAHMCFLQHTKGFTPGHALSLVVVLLAMVGVGVPNALIYATYLLSRQRVGHMSRTGLGLEPGAGPGPGSSSVSGDGRNDGGREGYVGGGSGQRVNLSHNDVALLRALLTIFLAFFLLTGPSTVAFVVRGSVNVSPFLYCCFVWLYAVNSSVNWIIYGVMSSRFRKSYVRTFHKLRALCRGSL